MCRIALLLAARRRLRCAPISVPPSQPSLFRGKIHGENSRCRVLIDLICLLIRSQGRSSEWLSTCARSNQLYASSVLGQFPLDPARWNGLLQHRRFLLDLVQRPHPSMWCSAQGGNGNLLKLQYGVKAHRPCDRKHLYHPVRRERAWSRWRLGALKKMEQHAAGDSEHLPVHVWS